MLITNLKFKILIHLLFSNDFVRFLIFVSLVCWGLITACISLWRIYRRNSKVLFSVIFHLRRWVATTVLVGAVGGALPNSRLHREVSVLQRGFCTKDWKSKMLTTQTAFFYIYYCCHLLYVLVCIYVHVYLYVDVRVCTHTYFVECIKMLQMEAVCMTASCFL